MDSGPLVSLIDSLGAHISQKKHSDRLLIDEAGKPFLIEPAGFVEIVRDEPTRRIAFVNSNDGQIVDSPEYMIAMNRVYYSLFQGRRRIRQSSNPRIQFMSCITLNAPADGSRRLGYSLKMFPYDGSGRMFPPDDPDLASGMYDASFNKINILARRSAEWRLAAHIVETELDKGDILIMDGSLGAGPKEARYADRLCDMAVKKGVIICGLVRNSDLITEAGESLIARVSEISRDTPYGRWYVRIAEKVSAYDMGFTIIAKFQPGSRFMFRLDILRSQFTKMSDSEIGSMLWSIAENSDDISMIGYPYGAIDADRFSQVRQYELDMYRRLIEAEMMKHPEWSRYNADMHGILSEVAR